MTNRSRSASAPDAVRVPVFRDAICVDFIDRAAGPEDTPDAPPPATGSRMITGRAGLHAENGIVHLAGELDDPHDIMTLRRIAASIPGTVLVIDKLWLACD
jgi:hypothetical protein